MERCIKPMLEHLMEEDKSTEWSFPMAELEGSEFLFLVRLFLMNAMHILMHHVSISRGKSIQWKLRDYVSL